MSEERDPHPTLVELSVLLGELEAAHIDRRVMPERARIRLAIVNLFRQAIRGPSETGEKP